MLRRFAVVLLTMPALCAGIDDLRTPSTDALMGREPYAEMAAASMPLPPTAAEVAALPAVQRMQQATAMKEVLLLRDAWMRANNNRSSAAIEADCAGAARAAEAPQLMVELLQLMADGNLSRPQAYAWRMVWENLLAAYSIDAFSFRIFVQELDLTADELRKLMPMLPLADMGNNISLRLPAEAQIVADLQLMAEAYTALAARYQLVEDAEGAARAADTLNPLIRELLTTTRTRFWMMKTDTPPTPAELEALKEANGAYHAFLQQRDRLAEQAFFGCLPLRVLDYLAD